MWRYFQVGIASNHRYLDALAAAPLKGEGVASLDALCRSRTKDGRHHARFNPLSPADRELFRAVLAGGHAITGFRNADLVARLYRRPPADAQEAHRRCARVSRLIAKLRGHGLGCQGSSGPALPPDHSGLPSHDRRARHARRSLSHRLLGGSLNPQPVTLTAQVFGCNSIMPAPNIAVTGAAHA